MAKSRQTGDLVSQNNLFVDNANDRIGIGTTNPTQKLQVYDGSLNVYKPTGEVQVQVESGDTSVAVFRAISPYRNWRFGIQGGANADFVIRDTTDSRNRLGITSAGEVIIGSNATPLVPTGTASQTLQITGGAYVSGSVGIGTTNPGNAFNFSGITSTTTKLDVRGKTLLFYDGDVSTGATSKSDMDTKAILKLRGTTNSSTNMQFATMSSDSGAMGIQVTNQANTANWDLLLNPFGGFVGIGITNPTTTLSIGGTVSSSSGFVSNGDLILECDYNQNNAGRDSIIFKERGSERVRITGDGSVGIGLTNPTANLQVSGTTLLTGNNGINTATNPNYSGTWFSFDAVPNVAQITAVNASTASLAFYTKSGSGAAPAERVRIDSSGNLGIGTTNPATKVRVEINSTDTFPTDGSTALTGGTNNNIVAANLSNNTTGISTAQVGFVLSAGGADPAQHGLFVQRTGTRIGDLVFRRRTATGSNESFTIFNDGITSFYNVVGSSQDLHAGRYYDIGRVLYHTSGESCPITSYARNSGIHTSGTYTGYTSIVGRYQNDTVYAFIHATKDASDVETVKAIISGNGRAAFHEDVLAGYTHNSTTSTPTFNYNTGENLFSATGRNASTHSSSTTYSSNAVVAARYTTDPTGVFYHYFTDAGANTVSYYSHNLSADGIAWHYSSIVAGRTASSTTGTPTYYYRNAENVVYAYAGTSTDVTYMVGRNVADASEVFYSEVANEANIRFTAAGDGYWDGTGDLGAADYAEYFEWVDGNPNGEDRVGKTVVLVDEKIRLATSSDNPVLIIGVVSGRPAIVGDSASLAWQGRYKKDEFNRRIYEDVEIYTWTDKGGNEMRTRKDLVPADKEIPENWVLTTTPALSLSEDYDPDMEYVPRSQRPEWDPIGLMGKLTVYKGQPVGDRWIKMKDINEQLEQWLVR